MLNHPMKSASRFAPRNYHHHQYYYAIEHFTTPADDMIVFSGSGAFLAAREKMAVDLPHYRNLQFPL